jgi:hypothetical protein
LANVAVGGDLDLATVCARMVCDVFAFSPVCLFVYFVGVSKVGEIRTLPKPSLPVAVLRVAKGRIPREPDRVKACVFHIARPVHVLRGVLRFTSRRFTSRRPLPQHHRPPSLVPTDALTHAELYAHTHVELCPHTCRTMPSHVPNYALTHAELCPHTCRTMPSHVPNYALTHAQLYTQPITRAAMVQCFAEQAAARLAIAASQPFTWRGSRARGTQARGSRARSVNTDHTERPSPEALQGRWSPTVFVRFVGVFEHTMGFSNTQCTVLSVVVHGELVSW